MLRRAPGVADDGDDILGGHVELAGKRIGERRADALPHLVAADADGDLPSSVALQMRDRRHDDAGIGADRHAPADERAIVGTHRAAAPCVRLLQPNRSAPRLQAFRDMARRERLLGDRIVRGVVGEPQRDRILSESCRPARRPPTPWRSNPDARTAPAYSPASARRCAPAARGRGNSRSRAGASSRACTRPGRDRAVTSAHPLHGSQRRSCPIDRRRGGCGAGWPAGSSHHGRPARAGRPASPAGPRRRAATAASTVCICSEFFWPKPPPQ